MNLFLRQFASFDLPKINAWVALRNTVGVALCLGFCLLIGKPVEGLVVGLGALVISYSDADDAYPTRAKRLSTSSFLCAFAVILGSLVTQNATMTLLLAMTWAFFAGLSVALGPMETELFLFSLVMFIIFATEPVPLARAFTFGLLTLTGGLIQTGLSIMFWPIRRYEPERRELGKLYLELSRFSRTPVRSRAAPLGSAQINRTHQALSVLTRGPGLEADRYRSMLSQAERIRISLLYLLRRKRWLGRKDVGEGVAETMPEAPVSSYETMVSFLEKSADALGYIAQTILTSEVAPHAQLTLEKLETLAITMRSLNGVHPDTSAQMSQLSGQLRAASGLAARSVPSGTLAFAKREARRPWKLRFQGLLATVRANLTLKSAACRHGIRMSIAIAVGEGAATLFHLQRSYWIPMTIVLVLKPEYTSTLSRGLLRILGTLSGLLFATAVFYFFPNNRPFEIAFVAFFMFMLRWVGSANYGIFTFMLSGMVVSLLALSGVDANAVIFARGVNTCIGGSIALAIYWIWPTWSRDQVQETIAEMLDAYRAYFHEVSQAYLNPDPGRTSLEDSAQNSIQQNDAIERARLISRLARSNQEVSSAHTEVEPGTNEPQKRLLRAMQASSNRFAYNVMALEAGDKNSFNLDEKRIFKLFSQRVEQTLFLLSEAMRAAKKEQIPLTLPDLRAAQLELTQLELKKTHSQTHAVQGPASVYAEIDRITNSLNTLREQVLRWVTQMPLTERASPTDPAE
jgi:uncharacterized membrane protein YccC